MTLHYKKNIKREMEAQENLFDPNDLGSMLTSTKGFKKFKSRKAKILKPFNASQHPKY